MGKGFSLSGKNVTCVGSECHVPDGHRVRTHMTHSLCTYDLKQYNCKQQLKNLWERRIKRVEAVV